MEYVRVYNAMGNFVYVNRTNNPNTDNQYLNWPELGWQDSYSELIYLMTGETPNPPPISSNSWLSLAQPDPYSPPSYPRENVPTMNKMFYNSRAANETLNNHYHSFSYAQLRPEFHNNTNQMPYDPGLNTESNLFHHQSQEVTHPTFFFSFPEPPQRNVNNELVNNNGHASTSAQQWPYHHQTAPRQTTNNAPPVDFELMGRVIQAAPVDLTPRLGPLSTVVPAPESMPPQRYTHSATDSLSFLERVIAKGPEALNDGEHPVVNAGELLRIRGELWDRDYLMSQPLEYLEFLRGPPEIPVSPWPNLSDDEEEEAEMINDVWDEPDEEMDTEDDEDEGMEIIFDRLFHEQMLAFQQNGIPAERIDEALTRESFPPLLPGTSIANEMDVDVSCSICRDEYKAGQDIGIMRCNHRFHYDCIEEWLIRRDTCPLCRRTALVN